MATIAVTALVPNAGTAAPAGTLSGATNTVSTGATSTIVATPLEEFILRAVVTTATTNVTVKAGDNPPALSAGQGDLTVACTVGTTYIGPLTSARFLQSDGTLNVDVATAANVTLSALRLPRTA